MNNPPRWPIGNTNIGRLLSIINDGHNFSNLINSMQHNNVMNSSLYDEPPIKNVVSEKGKEQLKVVKYTDKCCSNNSCPIMHIDFEDKEEIIVLPCGHGFNKDAITRWVSDEKAECPVCRFKLDSIEKKNKNDDSESDNRRSINITNINNIFTNSIQSTNPVFLNENYQPLNDGSRSNTVIYSHPFGPRIERVATIISEDDDHNDLMNAFTRIQSINRNRSTNNGINFRSIFNSPIFNIIQQDDFEDLSYNVDNPSLD